MTKKALQNIRDTCKDDDDFMLCVWYEMNMSYFISGIFNGERKNKKKYAEQRYKFNEYMGRYGLYRKAVLFCMYREIDEYKEYFEL